MKKLALLLVASLFGFTFLHAATAQTLERSAVVYVGSGVLEAMEISQAQGFEQLIFQNLPEPDRAQSSIMSAMLQAKNVSTMERSSSVAAQRVETLTVILDVELNMSEEVLPQIVVDQDTFSFDELATRVSGIISAFDSPSVRLMVFNIADQSGLFPEAIESFNEVVLALDAGLAVLNISNDGGTVCGSEYQQFEFALMSGIADRTPFGNGDGQTTANEAVEFVSERIDRLATRSTMCGVGYTVVSGANDTDRILYETPQNPLFPSIEAVVFQETFEALFLSASNDPEAINAYLETCEYCPNELQLKVRLEEIAEQDLAEQLETEIWNKIKDDDQINRLQVYLENCQACLFALEAQQRISEINDEAELRSREIQSLDALLQQRDLVGLRAWRNDCMVCESIENAEDMIFELEADELLQAENERLRSSISANNLPEIISWLNSCSVCDLRVEAENAISSLRQQSEASETCLQNAGLPQQGGPRRLDEIDQTAAFASCEAVLGVFPGSPEATVALGRAHQAKGDMANAQDAYAVGMLAGVPSAYGLAAYLNYAPGEDVSVNYLEAERLALIGYEKGDWLSGELLAILYSRELIEGKNASNAFGTVMPQAREGNPAAQFFVGYFYMLGEGVDLNSAEAVSWLESAVNNGYMHAASFLADLLEVGADGVDADPTRAADLYWLALQRGDATAQRKILANLRDRPEGFISRLQGHLVDAGVFNGSVDGIAGNGTLSAIETFLEQT